MLWKGGRASSSLEWPSEEDEEAGDSFNRLRVPLVDIFQWWLGQ